MKISFSVIWLLGLGFALIGGPILFTLPEPTQTNLDKLYQAPNPEHWLGTDALGRDVLSRVIYGGRTTLALSAFAACIGVVVGGLIAGLAGIHTDSGLDSVVRIGLDSWLAIPSLVFALLCVTILGRGWWQIAFAVGITQVPFYAYFAYDVVQQQHTRPYVLAAYSLGANRWHVLVQHIWPSSYSVMMAYAGIVWAYSLLNIGALGFLGLGGPLGEPEWGVILAEARYGFRTAPWIAVVTGLLLTITVININLVFQRWFNRHG